MHLVNTNTDFSVDVNPVTCILRIHIPQTAIIDGGTRRFAHASGTFTGAVFAVALAARNLDGSCSMEQQPVLEVDTVKGVGTLSP
jgi:hypothetical protein